MKVKSRLCGDKKPKYSNGRESVAEFLEMVWDYDERAGVRPNPLKETPLSVPELTPEPQDEDSEI